MADNEHPPKTPWGWFVVLAVVALGNFQLGWSIGRARVEDENQQLQRTKDWNLPAVLASMGQLSGELRQQLADKRNLDQLRVEVPRQRVIIRELQQKLSQAADQSKSLEAKIAACSPQTLEIDTGEARFLAGNELPLGVNETTYSPRTAKVQFAGQLREISPGVKLEGHVGDVRYAATLIKIDGGKCTFAITRSSP